MRCSDWPRMDADPSPAARDSSRGLDRDNLEGVQLAVLVADRDVFAWPESMRTEPIARFIVLLGDALVIEHPARVAGAARAVHQMSELVRLALPEAPHAAVVAVLAPQIDVDVAAVIERSDELVAMARGARRKFLRAGQIEPDAFEHMRQRGHVQSPGLPDSQPGGPRIPAVLQWERGTLTLRKVRRIAARSYFGHGPKHKASRSGHADAARLPGRSPRIPGGSGEPRAPERPAHRYARVLGVPGRRAGVESEAGGPLSVSRLLEPRQTPGGVRG